jgi:CelD/BcsL family acetyltransferase involved in cellulose biosynthesis
MQIRHCSNIEHWESLAGVWNSLTRGNPFASWEWLSNWWRYYGKGRELCVLAIQDAQGTVVGATPWYVERCATRGRVIRVLGSGEVCSEYLSVLCQPEHEDAVTDAVAHRLVARSQPRRDSLHWDLLALECVPVTDTASAKLIANLVEADCSIVRRANASCWSVDLPATWEEYVSLLSKSHRKQIQRAFRDEVMTGHAHLKTIDNLHELRSGMELLLDLHRRRWESLRREGSLSRERFAGFLRDVAPLLLRNNALQLSLLNLDGRCAAVDFHLVSGDTNYVYQGGIEPALAKHSPGSLLTALLIRDAIGRGRKRFDFLRGDEPYKSHFRAKPTATHDHFLVPRFVGPQLRHSVWLAGNMVKNLVRTGMSLTGMH